jgi:hypothetical protein
VLGAVAVCGGLSLAAISVCVGMAGASEDEKVGLVMDVAADELNDVSKIAHRLSTFFSPA